MSVTNGHRRLGRLEELLGIRPGPIDTGWVTDASVDMRWESGGVVRAEHFLRVRGLALKPESEWTDEERYSLAYADQRFHGHPPGKPDPDFNSWGLLLLKLGTDEVRRAYYLRGNFKSEPYKQYVEMSKVFREQWLNTPFIEDEERYGANGHH